MKDKEIGPDTYEIFLIGDTGNVNRTGEDAVLNTLKKHTHSAPHSAVIFLGDNIYPRGLPPEGNLLRKDAENTLLTHYNAFRDYQGKIMFISGNHDWNKGRTDGYEYVLRQEAYLNKLFGKNVFFPSQGCPGPTEVNLTPHLTVVLINTQWWLQTGYRPIGQTCGCQVESEREFFDQFRSILEKNAGRRILIAGHAPLYSYAIHGGRYKWRHHMFPFTVYYKKAYVPLPLIGSLLPIYRKYFGAKEDIAHPRYRYMRKQLISLFNEFPGMIYAAGHEHNLQHISRSGNHYIVSGAGSKLKYVLQGGKNLRFGMKAKGFFKIKFEMNSAPVVSAWITDSRVPEGVKVYESELF